MLEFLNMGGYALYVWTSYAVALVVLGGVVLWSARQHRSALTSAIRRAKLHRRKS
jgi:heme exporter protein D